MHIQESNIVDKKLVRYLISLTLCLRINNKQQLLSTTENTQAKCYHTAF